MLKRYKPLPRPTKPIDRKPLKRSIKPIARVGKVGKRKQAFRDRAKTYYFQQHSEKKPGAKTVTAPCQYCGLDMKKIGCHIHHKKPRGEGGPDTRENVVALHDDCHMNRVHNGSHGRPDGKSKAAWFRFIYVEASPANIINGQVIAPYFKEADV